MHTLNMWNRVLTGIEKKNVNCSQKGVRPQNKDISYYKKLFNSLGNH